MSRDRDEYDLLEAANSVKRYEELIKNYPGSKFVPDTYVQLGNHYFDVASDLAKAKVMYEKAFASANPKIKSYALYKLAWCDYNAGDHERALKRLQEVVDYAEKQDVGGKKQFTDLSLEVIGGSTADFTGFVRKESNDYARFVKDFNITPWFLQAS